ncbi:MAG TPA: hypothetical protein VE591_11195 [Candidatus Acidoferrum sp.]|nr:hypothetical protein [Candidatus Acidoferrum sp.]
MTLSTLLNIGAVLAAIYVSLSCFVSWIHEQVATVFQLRGAKLYRGVLHLVQGEEGLADALFRHPLIASGAGETHRWSRSAYRPPYVNPRNFSLALWQMVLVTQGGDPVWDIGTTPVSVPTKLMWDLDKTVGAMTAIPRLQQALTALLTEAGSDYEKLLEATDAWFNAQMHCVTGWYKRQTQWIIVAIAFVVVSFSGLDSVEIARGLGDNPASLDLVPYAHVTPAFWRNWYLHWPGMLITLVALSLGGPFWFDVLCRLVDVRNAGRKPQQTE